MIQVSKWFKGVRGRLFVMVALPMFLMMALAGTAWYGLRQDMVILDEVMEVRMPVTAGIGRIRTMSNAVLRSAFEASAHPELAARRNSVEFLKKLITDFDETLEQVAKLPLVEGGKKSLRDIGSEWKTLRTALQEVAGLLVDGANQDAVSQAQAILVGKAKGPANAISKIVVDWEDVAHQVNLEIMANADLSEKRMITFVLAVTAVGSIALMIIGFFIATTLSATLSELALSLTRGADEVGTASSEISSAATELSSSATQQAAAVQETVASLDQVSAMVNKNSDNAQRSQTLSQGSQEAANRGKATVTEMISSIDEISRSNTEIMQQIETSNREISEIVKVIAEIGNKTKVINDIVFQTKLLSFNASVEAARAGEHGKGFAVVAEEVGKLAQMSGNAAKEISEMLEGSIQKVEGIVHNTKSRVEHLVATGKQKVEAGSQTAQRCGEVLEEIVRQVSEVTQMVGEIATASKEQAQGVQEINKAMGQMDQVTQQNAAASQQSATAVEKLSAQAEGLRATIRTLHLTVEGGLVPKKIHASSRVEPHSGKVVSLSRKRNAVAAAAVPKAKATTAPVSHKEAKPRPMPVQSTRKVAVGAEIVPAESDSRFEDV